MTFQQSIQLTTITCSCGGVYAINEITRQKHRDYGTSWTCPYCKTGWGYRESEADRLRKEVTAAKTEALRQQHLRESVERERTQILLEKKRIEKRAKAALCPCCNRSFISLARHIQSKHPELAKPANKLQCKITKKGNK
jgi:hypothetical protein